MQRNPAPYDAPFFAKLLIGGLLAGCIGCFGVAGSRLGGASSDTEIVSVSAIYANKPPAPAKNRVGIMTERLRRGSSGQIARLDR